MKSLVRSLLRSPRLSAVNEFRQIRDWKKRHFLGNSLQFVKEEVFAAYGISGAPWVETGTHMGITTEFLAKRYPFVHTIEPAAVFYEAARAKFAGQNVNVILGTSETVFPELLPMLHGDINFWLDGHYSAGLTFKGSKECPVEDELAAISRNLANFSKVCILIDDIRCFLPDAAGYADYPSLDSLVDWARAHGFRWRVEHDILILRNG
ncbi:MAG: hypothetical protein ACLGHK_11940 [Alphaproteobacteria bacterium]